MRRCPAITVLRSETSSSPCARVVKRPSEGKQKDPAESSAMRWPREPEARGAHRAESDGDQERDAIAAREVVDRSAEPRRDAAPDAVADAQEAVDHAEAPPVEELRRDRGDDGPAGAEPEAEEQGVGIERRRVAPRLEPEQTE